MINLRDKYTISAPIFLILYPHWRNFSVRKGLCGPENANVQKTEIYGKKEEQSRKRSRQEGKEGVPAGGRQGADDP